jgi:hypothetical protein
MLSKMKDNPMLVVISMILGIVASVIAIWLFIIPYIQPQYSECNGTFYVPGAEENGIQCRASEAGAYSITYIDGAYYTKAKTSALLGEGIWRTTLCVLEADRPQRNATNELVCTYELFRPDMDRWDEVTQSQEAAQNHILTDGSLSTTINLYQNEVLTFVAKDVEDTYGDNGEHLRIEIHPLSQSNN